MINSQHDTVFLQPFHATYHLTWGPQVMNKSNILKPGRSLGVSTYIIIYMYIYYMYVYNSRMGLAGDICICLLARCLISYIYIYTNIIYIYTIRIWEVTASHLSSNFLGSQNYWTSTYHTFLVGTEFVMLSPKPSRTSKNHSHTPHTLMMLDPPVISG